MKIRINLKWIQIETETSKRQMAVFGAFLIFVLELVNLFVTKYDTHLFEIAIATIAGLMGYSISGKKGKA
ncbi:MAG: hypothetical protein QXT26_08590 [Thermoproteota archaeon]